VLLDAVEGVASTRSRRTVSAAPRGSGAPDPAVVDARLERSVLRVILQGPELLPEAAVELDDSAFHHPSAAGVWRAIAAAGGPDAGADAVLEAAEDDMVRDVVRGLLLEDDPAASDEEPELRRQAAHDLVHRLLSRALIVREQELRDRLARVDAVGDPTGLLALQGELQELAGRRRALRDGRGT
jgi:hypothetical protein